MKMENLKKYAVAALCLVLVAVMGFSALKILSLNRAMAALTQTIQDMQQEQAQQQEDQEEQREEFSESVIAAIEQGASLYTDAKISFSAYDKQTGEVGVTFYIVPKKVTGATTLRIAVAGKEVVCVPDGEGYTATVPVALFLEEREHALLIMEERDTVQREQLKQLDISYLYQSVLPQAEVELPMYFDYARGVFRLDSTLTIEYVEQEDVSIDIAYEKVELVAEIDGKEIERQDLTKEVQEAKGQFEQEVKEEYTVGKQSNLSLYVEMTDSLGYIHRTLVLDWNRTVDEDVEEDDYVPQVGDILILDAKKQVLNTGMYSQEQREEPKEKK